MFLTVLLMIAGLALATLIVYAGHVTTSKPVAPESLIDVDALRQLRKHRTFAQRYGVPAAQIPLQNWGRAYGLRPYQSFAIRVLLDRGTRRDMEKDLGAELGYKVMGNMMWTLGSNTPPRQVTEAERTLWKALVDAHVKFNVRQVISDSPNLGKTATGADLMLNSICRARQG